MNCLFILLLSSTVCLGAVFTPNRASSSVSVDSHGQIDSLTNQITACLWLSQNASAIHFGGNYFVKGNPGQYRLKNDGGAPFDWDIFDHVGGESLWRSTTSFTVSNTIIFVALTYTYTDTNSFKLYSNGVLMPGIWINNPTNAAGVSNDVLLAIGGGVSGGRSTGYYSDMALWGSILTAQQLELIRTSHVKGMVKQISPSTLRMYIPLDNVPDGLSASGTDRFPDRGPFVPYAGYAELPITIPAAGMAERICSYPPNE